MKMNLEEAYKNLDCDFKSSKKKCKKKYHELSLKYHPDKNFLKTEREKLILEEKFKKISNSYDFLENYWFKECIKNKENSDDLSDFKKQNREYNYYYFNNEYKKENFKNYHYDFYLNSLKFEDILFLMNFFIIVFSILLSFLKKTFNFFRFNSIKWLKLWKILTLIMFFYSILFLFCFLFLV